MKWKCLNSEYLVNSKWLKVRRDEVQLPNGTIMDDYYNDSDNPLDVAKRELREETGYKSDNWECLGTLFDYPTKDTNTISLYLAKNIYKVGEQELDISEDITFDFVPIKEAIQMCIENKIQVSGSVAALMKVFYQM